ncbi:MAG TPA: single-stranded-DNA-specific exonuclease RecJ, partial [Proteobacteria bacterium]|nr:single-stranded-DNA-specific exonuclease RecJ [Pseudomonadota bacterium]
MTKAVWALRAADERTVRELVDSGVREITARLLASRGVKDANEAQRFLNPSLESLAPATGLPDIDEASELVVRAIRDKRRICIYGDFDADGITSTALAVEFFRSLGIECSYYIPDRELEGYGISREGIAKIAESGAKLLITADCGTTNADEVD